LSNHKDQYVDVPVYLEERQEQQKIMNDENEDEDEDADDDKEEEEEEEESKEVDEDGEHGEDEDDADEEEEPQKGPPLKITKNVNGGKRNFYLQTTLKSIEELKEFRFKVMKK
jgi:hypothetical protein